MSKHREERFDTQAKTPVGEETPMSRGKEWRALLVATAIIAVFLAGFLLFDLGRLTAPADQQNSTAKAPAPVASDGAETPN